MDVPQQIFLQYYTIHKHTTLANDVSFLSLISLFAEPHCGTKHTGQEDQFNLKKIDHDFWVNFLISGIILIARIAINNFWDNGPWRKWVFLIWPICHIYAPFNIVWKSALYVSFHFWIISNHCYDLKNELSTMQYPHLVTLNMIL